jgi:sporulation protein YlmC with PRC-barrel domain
MRLSDGDLRGRTVIAADGQIIGDITAVFLDSDTWTIDALQVQLRREAADKLGAARSMFRTGSLEIPVRTIQSVGTAVVLSVRSEELRPAQPTQPSDDQPPAP